MAIIIRTDEQLQRLHAWACHLVRMHRVRLPELVSDGTQLATACVALARGASDQDVVTSLRTLFGKDRVTATVKQVRRLREILPEAARLSGPCTRLRPDGIREVVPPLTWTGHVHHCVELAWVEAAGRSVTLPRLLADERAFSTTIVMNDNRATLTEIAQALTERGNGRILVEEVRRLLVLLDLVRVLPRKEEPPRRRRWAGRGRRRATSSDVQRSSALVAASLVRHAFPPIDSSGLARIAHQTATGLGFASVRDLAASVVLAAALSASASSSTPPSAGTA